MMRITSKGQATISADNSAKAGLLPDTEVGFSFEGRVVTLETTQGRKESQGARLVRQMRGRGDVARSTDAIMDMTRKE